MAAALNLPLYLPGREVSLVTAFGVVRFLC